MRLERDVPNPSNAVAHLVAAALDRRLRRNSPRPLAIGLSGGGDSLALLLTANAWAQDAGRPLLVLTVDHGLQPQSRAWTVACAAHAARLGVGFAALAWTGEKPSHGLPAAARAARHRLLAEAARQAGASVILLGHTADDVLETRAMQAAGARTPEPREWAPSPVWPEGRGVFLLRPMLALRRETLRAWLAARGEVWIEDPANADPRFARARARAALDGDLPDPALVAEPPLPLAAHCEPIAGGGLQIRRSAFRAAPADQAERLTALAAVCAGGGARLPGADARRRLAAHLRGEAEATASLAGARVVATAARVLFTREAGERARGGLTSVALAPNEATVWDGRFEICTRRESLTVRPLAGVTARLPASERRALAALPAAVRPALPTLVDAAGAVTCPVLAPCDAIVLRPLVEARLAAAAGQIEAEPA